LSNFTLIQARSYCFSKIPCQISWNYLKQAFILLMIGSNLAIVFTLEYSCIVPSL
jgi:hypothetical protein